MPTTIRTPFAQGGTMVADPMDQIEGMQWQRSADAADAAQQRNFLSDQNNRMMQLALARLGNENAWRSADRQQAMALAQAGLGFQREMLGAEKDRFGQQIGLERDLARQRHEDEGPNRALASAQSDYMQKLLAGGLGAQQEQQKRAQTEETNRTQAESALPTPDLTDPDVGLAYNSTLSATGNKGEATAAARQKAVGKASSAADTEATALANQVADFKSRDTAWLSRDPSDQERMLVERRFNGLVELYKKAGLPDAQAKTKAQESLGPLSDANKGLIWGADQTAKLYQELGLR